MTPEEEIEKLRQSTAVQYRGIEKRLHAIGAQLNSMEVLLSLLVSGQHQEDGHPLPEFDSFEKAFRWARKWSGQQDARLSEFPQDLGPDDES